MEWQAPAVVLAARPLGEGGAVVTVLTEAQGRHAGLVKGGAGRNQAGLWQAGNLVEARWVARLADQLGSLRGEMAHPAAALALHDPLALAVLAAACAVAESVLPERQPHPACFRGLVALIAGLAAGGPAAVAAYIHWEAALLAELGYGLDLTRCALTGGTDDLAYVSPRSGRAVGAAAGAAWKARLLPLPRFLLGQSGPVGPEDWAAGLRLTGHFLGRHVGRGQAGALPAARSRLVDRVAATTTE